MSKQASPPPPPLHRNRDYVALTTGQVVEAVGSGMTGMALLLLTYSVTGSSAQAGIVSAGYGLGQLIMGLPAGAYVDRWGRKRTLIVASLALAAIMATVPIADALGRLTFLHLLAVAVLEGGVAAFVWPAGRAAMKAVVPASQLGTAATVSQARMSVGGLVGPALSGALFAVTRSLPLITNAALYLVAAIGYRLIKAPLLPPERAPENRKHLVREVGEGLRWVWRTAPVRDMVIIGMVLNLAVNGLITVAILALQRDGLAPAALGALESAMGAAGLLGALVAGLVLKRLRVGTVAFATIWIDIIVLAFMPLALSVWWVGVLMCLVAVTMPAINAGMGAFMMHITPEAMQGRSGSASSFVSMAMMPLGIGAAGILLEHVGRTPALLVYVALLGVAGVLATMSRNVRGIPRTDRFDEVPEVPVG